MPALLRPDGVLTISTTFKVGATLTDPSTITLTVRKPDGTSTVYVYNTDVELVKDSTGTYHLDVTTPTSGVWSWHWKSTGAAAGGDDGSFSVEVSLLTVPGFCSLDDIHTVRQDVTAGARDELIMMMIAGATSAIEADPSVAGRQFLIDAAASDRYFPLAGCDRDRIVLIDDLSAAPTQAEVLDADGASVQTLVVATDLVAEPRNRRSSEPITSLRLRSSVTIAHTYELRVRGIWGWPAVPGYIREACVETVVDWMKNHQALTAQSPDAFDPGQPPQRALPQKARDLIRRARNISIA